MSTIFVGDEEHLSAFEGAKKHLPLDPSEVDDFLGDLEVQEILSPFTSPGTSNQPNNGDDVYDALLVVDVGTPFHHPASNLRLQEITNQLGSSDQAPSTTLPLQPAAHKDNDGFLVPPPPPAVVVQPPPQNYDLQPQAIDHTRPPRVYSDFRFPKYINTAFHQTPMIMAAATTSKNLNEGGFGHPIGQPIYTLELATSSLSLVPFGYQESYGTPFPPPLMHSGRSIVNQDQYITKRVHAASPLTPRINDERPYSSYDLHILANSSHAMMNAPAAWPPSSPTSDYWRFSMPNYSSDQRPEISSLPSTSHGAFAGTEGVWDVDQFYNMEVVEDAMPLEIIDPPLSNGGVEDKKMKKKTQVMRWTVEEHIAMLQGVSKYGKGNWKIISREFVNSKSPVQIASHYQKYDVHHKGKEKTEGTSVDHKRKKRKSIHDITIDDLGTSRNGTAI